MRDGRAYARGLQVLHLGTFIYVILAPAASARSLFCPWPCAARRGVRIELRFTRRAPALLQGPAFKSSAPRTNRTLCCRRAPLMTFNARVSLTNPLTHPPCPLLLKLMHPSCSLLSAPQARPTCAPHLNLLPQPLTPCAGKLPLHLNPLTPLNPSTPSSPHVLRLTAFLDSISRVERTRNSRLSTILTTI